MSALTMTEAATETSNQGTRCSRNEANEREGVEGSWRMFLSVLLTGGEQKQSAHVNLIKVFELHADASGQVINLLTSTPNFKSASPSVLFPVSELPVGRTRGWGNESHVCPDCSGHVCTHSALTLKHVSRRTGRSPHQHLFTGAPLTPNISALLD